LHVDRVPKLETHDSKHIQTDVALSSIFIMRFWHTITTRHSPSHHARKARTQLITPCSQLVYRVEWIIVCLFPHNVHFSLHYHSRHLRAALSRICPNWLAFHFVVVKLVQL